jgi:hypothetical protein
LQWLFQESRGQASPKVKPLTFSPVQAARLLCDARKKVKDLTAQVATGGADSHFTQMELLDPQKKLQMLEQVPVRRKKKAR